MGGRKCLRTRPYFFAALEIGYLLYPDYGVMRLHCMEREPIPMGGYRGWKGRQIQRRQHSAVGRGWHEKGFVGGGWFLFLSRASTRARTRTKAREIVHGCDELVDQGC
jgi:hypothetical protein